MTAVTVRVPAKVNLQLAVGPVRPDGFHELVTVFHAVSLYDEVTVGDAGRRVTVTGEGADSVPAGDGNLAVQAVAALAKAAGLPPRRIPRAVTGLGGAEARAAVPGVSIEIRKRIPVAAGLAGGSADAAATLVACNELWRTGLSQAELCELAAGIGSDVAFGLVGGTAIGVGRGERVTPALATGSYQWVLAFATGGLSTAEVYAACDRLRAARGKPGQPAPELDRELMAALRSGNASDLAPLLANDLQAAAVSLRPELRRTLAAGTEHGALAGIVSGSGPTCVYLAKDARHAAALAVSLAGAGVCRTVSHVVGPAPGASVTGVTTEPA